MMLRTSSLVLLTTILGACGGSTTNADAPVAPSATSAEETDGGEPLSPEGNDGSIAAHQPDETEPSATAAGDDASAPAGGDAKKEGVPTKRPMDSIVKVIQDNRHLFRLCYEKVQKEKKDIKGDVVINFRITSAGKVVDAQVNQEGTTLKDEDVGSCAANEMKKLTFPEVASGMDTEINYPFNFNPK